MITDCSTCAAMVNAEVLEHYKHCREGELDRHVYFARCPRCYEPLLLQTEQTGPDEFTDPDRLYPPSNTRSPALLPRAIHLAFDEANACLRARAYTAAALMCRKTLEGICAEHGARERNLVKALLALKGRGIVDQRLYEWAEELRLVGNEAAHDVQVTVSGEDARDAIEFTAALLEYLFTFRGRFERLGDAAQPLPGEERSFRLTLRKEGRAHCGSAGRGSRSARPR